MADPMADSSPSLTPPTVVAAMADHEAAAASVAATGVMPAPTVPASLAELADVLHGTFCDCGDRGEHETSLGISYLRLVQDIHDRGAAMAGAGVVKPYRTPEGKVQVAAYAALVGSVAGGIADMLVVTPAGWSPVVTEALRAVLLAVAVLAAAYAAPHTPRPDLAE